MSWRRLPLSGSILPSARRLKHTLTDDECTSHLLKQRTVFFIGPISEDTASVVVPQLTLLESENPSKPVHVYINSSGGSFTAALTIYEMIQRIHSPVSTYCIGHAFSMGSLLLAAAAPGERRAFLHSMIKASDVFGQTTDIKVRGLINELYRCHTEQPIERIEQFMNNPIFMFPEEAKEFGLIDEIIH